MALRKKASAASRSRVGLVESQSCAQLYRCLSDGVTSRLGSRTVHETLPLTRLLSDIPSVSGTLTGL